MNLNRFGDKNSTVKHLESASLEGPPTVCPGVYKYPGLVRPRLSLWKERVGGAFIVLLFFAGRTFT